MIIRRFWGSSWGHRPLVGVDALLPSLYVLSNSLIRHLERREVMDTDDLTARLTRLEERVGYLERLTGGSPQGPRPQSKKLSAKEFLLAKNVTSELQRVLALAYFLEHQEGVTSFNVA